MDQEFNPKSDIGRLDYPQDFCPECFEAEDLQDRPDGNGDLFVTCGECGFQWHEPDVEDCHADHRSPTRLQ